MIEQIYTPGKIRRGEGAIKDNRPHHTKPGTSPGFLEQNIYLTNLYSFAIM